jgi:predicted O-methyltransferase YrrM
MNLSNKELEKLEEIQNINNIILNHTNKVEGNCLYKHLSNFEEFEEGMRYDNKLILRKNLHDIAKNVKNIIEIGLNGGHSAAIFFLANPELKFLSFDICEHKYVEDIANYYKSKYNFEFVKGDSLIKVKEYINDIKYDVIHIDGGHHEICVRNDLINCKKFAHENTLMIFDDSNATHIENILNEFCENNFIKEIDYSIFSLRKCYFHRIFKYNL